jgi:hypothetical protein
MESVIFKQTIKNIIKQILPYFIVQYRINRNQYRINRKKDSFNEIWDKYKGAVILPPIKNTFKYIVSVQGFGHSGSGAVIDLLREVPKATVLGGVDVKGSKSKAEEAFPEFDLLRVAGGLLEIEKLIDSENIFINDALVNRFISLLDHALYLNTAKNNEMQMFLLNFMTEIIDFSISSKKEYFNPHLGNHKRLSVIYFLKHLSKEEYINHCSELLQGIFSLLGNNQLLVLDQLFSDIENNIARNKQYVANLKTIMVQRDPRDVFLCASDLNEEWIPYNNVTDFVRWYNILLKNYPCIDTEVLNLRFEDLVINYDREKIKILNFLELEQADHIHAKTKFVPEISVRNIGLWKYRKDCKPQIAYIEKNLADWCYNG